MKKTGLLLGALAFLAQACSSHVSPTTSVMQGGFHRPEPAPPPAPERSAGAEAESATVTELTAEIPPPEPAAPPEDPAPVLSAAVVAPPAEAPPVEESPEPIWTEVPAAATEGDADVYPEEPGETEPAPEIVGPDDERIIEEIKGEEAAEAAPEVSPEREILYDIPLELHPKVLDYIELFQTSRRKSFTRGLSRSGIYEEEIKAILREEGMPTDLYYLALIESAFNPKAYSRARAMGIWQFIYTTGRAYGLRRTHWLDERRDPEKATRAAARHLKDLHGELGSWPLALAAYNAGVNRVKRAIRKAGTRDFWALRLPAQTRNYVPAFYAALIIGKEPERYGFSIDYDPPLEYETVEVDGGTRLSLVASFCNTSLQQIRDLNPELRQNCAPPGGKYGLRVPPESSGEVLAGLARTPKPKITGWDTHLVRSGDTLSTIARRYGTSVAAIQEVNNLPGHLIRAGDRLVIPGSGIASGSIPDAPDIDFAIPASGTYRVRRGDTLWDIARRYGMSLEALTAMNGLSGREVLSIGQVLRLRAPAAPRAEVAAAKAGGSGGTTLYRVRRGDTLWSIARRFDTDLKDLLQANRMSPRQVIHPGERLVIPD